MIKPGSVPPPATTHLQHPHHQSHQMPVVLSVKAQAGHLSPSEHRDLSTAITHLSDALTTTPPP